MPLYWYIPNGRGGCVCGTCDCSTYPEVQAATGAAQTRTGWNGFDGSCQIYRQIHLTAHRDGGYSLEQMFSGDDGGSQDCTTEVTGTMDLDAVFRVDASGAVVCTGATGTAHEEVSGQGRSGNICVDVGDDMTSTLACSDIGYGLGGTDASTQYAQVALHFGNSVTYGWPLGCNTPRSADWPYIVWQPPFLILTGRGAALMGDCDDGGDHFVFPPGSGSGTSRTWTLDAHAVAGCEGGTLTIDDGGSVTATLSDEWTVDALVDEVVGTGSDGFSEGGGDAYSYLTADTLTAGYRATRYRWHLPANPCTVTWQELTVIYSGDPSGDVLSHHEEARSLDLPTATADEEWSDWYYLYPSTPTAGQYIIQRIGGVEYSCRNA